MKLITLRLACCQYISRETLQTVIKECPVLEGTCKCVFHYIYACVSVCVRVCVCVCVCCIRILYECDS